MPDYPERAVFETMVNALIHRDYTNIGSEVHIDMYDDRLAITSPGGMFGGKKIQELDLMHVPSSRRNPVLSDLFHRLNFMERRGSGIKKILKEYENKDVPNFFSDQSYFIVTLTNKNYKQNQNTSSEKGSEKSAEKSSEKSSGKILEMIGQNKSVSAATIAKSIGLSSRTVEKHIAKLKESGRLKRVGSDKGGYWEIIEK